MKKDITELYCCVEDFCRAIDENFANRFLSNGKKPTNPSYGLVDKERHRNRRLFGLHGVGNQNRKNMN